MVTFMMSQTLRDLSLHSIQLLVQFIEQYQNERDPIAVLFDGAATSLAVRDFVISLIDQACLYGGNELGG